MKELDRVLWRKRFGVESGRRMEGRALKLVAVDVFRGQKRDEG